MSWETMSRPTGDVLLHSEKAVWIVHYPATYRSGEHWQTYVAIEPVKNRKTPWSVNNRRLGSEHGFPTLDAAKAAGDAA